MTMKRQTRIFWKAFIIVMLSISSLTGSSFSQPKPLGLFEGQADVGQIKNPGSTTYDAEKQEYTITGSGTNMWFDRDEFHFVWKRMTGNFILRNESEKWTKNLSNL